MHSRTRITIAFCAVFLLIWAAFVVMRLPDHTSAHSSGKTTVALPDHAAAASVPGHDADGSPPDLGTTRVPAGAVPASAQLPWPASGQAAIEVGGVRVTDGSELPEPAPIASVAKIMTAYLVLRHDPLRDGDHGFTVTFGDRDVKDYRMRAADGQSVVRVRSGEQLNERQLLEALLLPSGNNIAIVLAVHQSGSVAAFASQMNAAAQQLGMRHTTYTDPSGLDAGTISTAADQLRLVNAALKLPTFAAVVRLRSVSLPVAGQVRNTNPLLRYPGYLGVKTGSDDAAGGCLAFAVSRVVSGRRVLVVGVVLGQRGSNLLTAAGTAARELVDAAYRAIRP